MKRPMAATVAVAVSCPVGAGRNGRSRTRRCCGRRMPPPTFGGRLIGRPARRADRSRCRSSRSRSTSTSTASTRARGCARRSTTDPTTASRGCTRCAPGREPRPNGFAYWNGEQKIVGEVFERGVARQVYQNVTRRRRDPGLLEETGDGVFSFAVSPIEPGERKRVEVNYGQWLARHVSHGGAARADHPPGQRHHRDDLGRARAARDRVAARTRWTCSA